MMPHSGRVWLDRIGPDAFMVTHTTTQERVKLVGKWSLAVDEGNTERGVLMRDTGTEGQPELQALEDVLRKDIGVSPSGERFLLTRIDDQVHHQSFDELMGKMLRACVSVRMLTSSATCDISVYVMKMSRACGQLVVWPLVDVYSMLDLSCFNRQAPKWIFQGLPRRAKFMAPHLPGSLVVYSKHGNLSDARLRQLPWYERCLPQTSLATVGLLLLLSRWSFAKAERGGLREQTPREVAAQALRWLISQACAPSRCRPFVIRFDKDWVCTWHRPSLRSAGDGDRLSLIFLCGGKLSAVSVAEAPQPIHLMRIFKHALVNSGMQDGVVELDATSVVEASVGVQALQLVLVQLLLQAANQLEAALGDQHLGKGEAGAAGFQMETNQVSVASGHMDEQLFQ